MIDSAMQQPIKVGADTETGPYIRVSVQPRDRVPEVLHKHDIRHWVDNYSVSIAGRPDMTWVYVRKGTDPDRVQTLLDAAVTPSSQ
jgi:hypothetical protein